MDGGGRGGVGEGGGDGEGAATTPERQGRQLSFVNGGWVQHDEAAAFWEDMVDQTARGHAWLADTFADLGVLPTVGWQVDPFGHSATHADLLVAGAGMDAVFFGRADAQDLALRAREGDLEVVWEGGDGGGGSGDESLPSSVSRGGVLAGTFASGNYGPPPGFNWVRIKTYERERARGREIARERERGSLKNLSNKKNRTGARATTRSSTRPAAAPPPTTSPPRSTRSSPRPGPWRRPSSGEEGARTRAGAEAATAPQTARRATS